MTSIQVVVPEPACPGIQGVTILAIVVTIGIVATAGYVIIRRFRPRLR